MVQNNKTTSNIVLSLINESLHLREIARKLQIPHVTIMRKIKILEKENILDYKKEGKNKKFFIKKNSESLSSIIIAENYKLIEFIKEHTQLRTLIEYLKNNNKIEMAIIFGSYAKKTEKNSSDIDIYIKTKDKEIKNKIKEISSKVSIKIGNLDEKNPLVKEIQKFHIIIKGAEKYHEQQFIFN